jgi:signal transduction histidine kinase
MATLEAILLATGVTASLLGFMVVLSLIATTAKYRARMAALAVCIASPLSLLAFVEPKALERSSVFVQMLELALVIVFPLLVFISSRLARTREIHVGTPFDQRVVSRETANLALLAAEQDERFQIAREISEVILQDITAVLSQAEGGIYAAKLDPAVALRVLEKVSANARSAHQELRRLYDQLNRNLGIQAAPPGLEDLQKQIMLLREFGYTANLRHSGERFELTEGAQLAIYRLVFDALENVKDHAPIGSSVSVDFTWVGEGLQVLVKDNGIETSNRASRAVAEVMGATLDTSYSAEEDLDALVKPIIGASITAMRERAALYGGAVEVASVPGVGFTVSAIFPQLRDLAGTSATN